MFQRILTPILLSFSLAACGTSTNSDGGGGSSGIAATDLAAATIDAFCTKLISCPGAFDGMSIATMDGCKGILGSELDMSGISKGIAAGTVAYDPAKASACLSAMTTTCDFLGNNAQPQACKEAIAGLVETGKACTTSNECKSGTCDKKGDCPGTCKAFIAAGGDCSMGGICAEGLHCISEKCTATGWGGKDGACSNTQDCDATAYCLFAAGGGKCTARAAAGENCGGSATCVAGYQCGKGSTCVALGKVGDACEGLKTCGDGLLCAMAADGKSASCIAAVAPGGACTSTSKCRALDNWCTGTEGAKTCQALPGKGAACATGNDQMHPFTCNPPSVCDGTTCGDRLPKDAACVDVGGLFNPCATGLKCTKSKCTPLPAEGEACTGTCATGLTCDFTAGKCIKAVCQ